MSEPLVRLSIRAPLATLILQRPQAENALDARMVEEITRIFADLHLEKRVKAVILAGSGETFCGGPDPAAVEAERLRPDAARLLQEEALARLALLETLLRFPKPIVAAVHGAVRADGLCLLLAADLVVAGAGTTLALPEVRQGEVAGLVAPLLAFRAGAGPAAYLLLTGRSVDATAGHRYGLLHEIVPDEHVWVKAAALAEETALASPAALLMTKRLLNETVGENLFAQLAAGAALAAAARCNEPGL